MDLPHNALRLGNWGGKGAGRSNPQGIAAHGIVGHFTLRGHPRRLDGDLGEARSRLDILCQR